MRLEPIPDDQQGLFQVSLERFEEIDDFFFLDAALVQSEHAVGARHSCDDRDVIPVEVKLDDGRLSFGSPGTYTWGSLADARLVHKNDHSPLSLGFF